MTDLHQPDTSTSLGERAYHDLRARIVRLEFAPGDVLKENDLQELLGVGRTPIREALQRLAREHFVTVIPRRGMYVSGIELEELSLLFETRTVLEPYAARLAATRGTDDDWVSMAETLDQTHQPGLEAPELLELDRRCHEIMWSAAGNRFLVDTLDMLYAQSDRLWHLYLSDVSDMDHAVEQHTAILEALRSGDGDAAAEQVDAHVRAFDQQVRAAVTERLTSPLAG